MSDDAVKDELPDEVNAPLEDQLEVFLTKVPNRELVAAVATVLRRRAAAVYENEDADGDDPNEDDAAQLAALATMAENTVDNLSC